MQNISYTANKLNLADIDSIGFYYECIKLREMTTPELCKKAIYAIRRDDSNYRDSATGEYHWFYSREHMLKAAERKIRALDNKFRKLSAK